MSTSGVILMSVLFVISVSLDISDRRGRIHRKRKRNIPRFDDQSPSSNAFNFPAQIRAKYGIKGNTGSGIYGIADTSDGECALLKYDTKTGNATTLQSPNGNIMTGESLGCLDDIHNVFFFVYETTGIRRISTGLYPYNLADDTITYDPILLPMIASNQWVGAGDACASDPNTGDLYVFGHDVDNSDYQLLLRVSFDPTENKSRITQIGNYSTINDIPLLSGDITLYDSKRNMLWFTAEQGRHSVISTIDYLYIDAKTGEIKNEIGYEDVAIETGVYNPKLDKVVGLNYAGRDIKGFISFQMVYADPVTLKVTKTFDAFSNHYCSWTAVYSQDVDAGVYYEVIFQSVDNVTCDTSNGTYGLLVGVNVTTGNVVSEPQFCIDMEGCPWDLQYWDGK